MSLIRTIPNSSTQPQPKSLANGLIVDSGYTGQYIDNLTTIINTINLSENTTKVKLPNLSIMTSTKQAQPPTKILKRETRRNIPHRPLQSHFNWLIVW